MCERRQYKPLTGAEILIVVHECVAKLLQGAGTELVVIGDTGLGSNDWLWWFFCRYEIFIMKRFNK